MINGLSLFSGIGGLDVALSEWVKPIAYCEIDPYCQSVLLQRMQEENLPKAPIWDDIRSLDLEEIRGAIPMDIQIIYGGFPCQDISCAGTGKGLEGERSKLFFEIVRLAKEIKPKFLFLENVPTITAKSGLRVVREITSLGYDCRWCIISAASVGALHLRKRWFLLAKSQHNGSSSYPEDISKKENSKTMSLSSEREAWGNHLREYWPFASRDDWKKSVSNVYRIADGLPCKMDRFRALGNSVVPQQAKQAFKILMGL
jgi:DNA (cytosine-5)-methyltransferase 1